MGYGRATQKRRFEKVELKFIAICVRCCRRMIIIGIQFLFMCRFLAVSTASPAAAAAHTKLSLFVYSTIKKIGEEEEKIDFFSSASIP